MPLEGPASALFDQAEAAIDGLRDQRARLLALASVIAHMAGRCTIGRIHVAEAISYWPRPL